MCVWLFDALSSQRINGTMPGRNPNHTHDESKPYLEIIETVLNLYTDKSMFPFLLRGAHKKELVENWHVFVLKPYAKPFSDSK